MRGNVLQTKWIFLADSADGFAIAELFLKMRLGLTSGEYLL
jgi:hypothetical protein